MPLKIIVVGAGIGGLGAAIALTRAGHDVEVFEQSSFLNEVGAAIHVPPNATKVLKRWGCNLEDLQPVWCKSLNVYDKDGVRPFIQFDAEKLKKELNIHDEWILTHRVDLHNTLRKLAGTEVNGRTPKINLASRVESFDAKAGEVTFQDGAKRKADLIIGADGVHSRATEAVTGEPTRRTITGQSCFRFLVPMDKALSNPLTGPLFEKIGLQGMNVFSSQDRRLVIYPCRSSKLLNIVAIHPREGGDGTGGDAAYQAGGTMEDLLETYSEFGPAQVELCRLGEDIKLWSLASRDPPLVFWKRRLALVGDAAHPTLPHQGQGGAQAIEDGAALGVLFPSDTRPDQVPERLALYNKVRYPRAVTVLFMSRTNEGKRDTMMDNLRKFVPDAQLPKDMFEYTWTSDTLGEAQLALGKA